MTTALRVMTYFKVSLSTCNWDSAFLMGAEKSAPYKESTNHAIPYLVLIRNRAAYSPYQGGLTV